MTSASFQAQLVQAYRDRLAGQSLQPDAAQERALGALADLAGRIAGWSPGVKSMVFGRSGPGARGVYLCGGVGRGKSMMMDMFFDAAPTPRKRRAHFHEFMQEVHAGIAQARIAQARNSRAKDPIAQVAQTIANQAWLLCFDEIQVTNITDAMILGRLFEGLFGRGVVLVATSNRLPDALYDNGINRQLFVPFIDLLKSKVDVVTVDGPRDYRLGRRTQASGWFTPLNDATDAAMDAAWHRALAGEGEQQDTLTVQGRELLVRHTGTGVARFSFAQLCGEALGAGDYLAIAQRYTTVLVEDVPILGPENRNEAVRFVTLIDALYEAKTCLLASAAGTPDSLYPKGDGAFEFQRTASRLHEMQSVDYVAAARATE